MRERKIERLREKWINYSDLAKHFSELEETTESEKEKTKFNKKRHTLWKKWGKLGKKIYYIETKEWKKKFYNKIVKDPTPYSGGYWILEALFLLIERCYDYYTHGYNVYSDDAYRKGIIDSVSQAMLLIETIRSNEDIDIEFSEKSKALLENLIKIMTNDIYNWYD